MTEETRPGPDPREVARMNRELDQLTADRLAAMAAVRTAQEDVNRLSAEGEQIVIALLRAGVPRKTLINRPFSGAALTTIQRRHGLTRRQQKEPPSDE